MGRDAEKKIVDSIDKLLFMLFLLPMPGGMRNRAYPKGCSSPSPGHRFFKDK